MKKILGLPRWLAGALALGILLSYVLFSTAPEEEHVPSPLVPGIIEGLRTSSVYAAPGAPPVVDVARARQVIGDRPIVVVLLDRTPLAHEDISLERQNLCQDVADATPTNLVMVFAADSRGPYDSSICMGPDFSNPTNPLNAKNFDLGLDVAADTASTYRSSDTNMTPKIEEYVLAFDHQVSEDKYPFTPRRAIVQPPPPTASALQTWQIVLAVAGLIVAVVAVFAVLQLVVRLLQHRQNVRMENDSRATAMSARLNRLADKVLRPDKPGNADDAAQQAEVARRYVLALQQFEQDGPNDETETQVGELEELVKA